ncbi:hypothetical protein ACP3VQ_15080 [Metapseudomonas otitidis]|uniref:hypothetical protein n=1 Tax=Metapseudomonas otitidis TaxID=319939 RepID=UPI003CE84C48
MAITKNNETEHINLIELMQVLIITGDSAWVGMFILEAEYSPTILSASGGDDIENAFGSSASIGPLKIL